MRVLVDGRGQDLLEVVDRGLQYGDGLFETIRLRDERPCQWQRHLDRLACGAGRLGIPSPDPKSLAAEIADAAHGLDDGVLKLILTRGRGGRGYRPPDSPQPRRILLTYPLPLDPLGSWEEGVSVRYCRTPASINPALAGIKHLNRLDSVLGSREWSDPTIAEGLMLDPSGGVVGGTRTNLFLWDGRRLLTPPVDRSGIAGTRRALTMDLAAQSGLDCVESRLEPADLSLARGLFLTNAIVGIWPVRELAGHSFDLTRLPWSLLDAVRQAAQTPG
ncbi:aminodeoxychorismate lyase [Thiocystis violascens DSM 198]|uniref:Aminodeoxychorismate lyase n=1 Tax=Thiocystis violascens (strain ATCC 17096 / DSM 198 / 6111) TaxID=765911 RepID=I3Y545_THIV6|nr:aminodeoxychorismate lyase [Thiocystis violascens DSM 198]